MSESCENFNLQKCRYVQSVGDLSNLRTSVLYISMTSMGYSLQEVKGLDELEFLHGLQVRECGLSEILIYVPSTKLPNHCRIHIFVARKLLGLPRVLEAS